MFEETLDETGRFAPKRVGFGPRLAVMLIDAFFIMLLLPIVAYLLMSLGMTDFLYQKGIEALKADDAVIESLEKLMGDYFDLYLAIAATAASVAILYNFIEGFTGASPGKMILGLKIANQDGRAADVNVFMMRWLMKNFSAIFVVINLQLNSDIIQSIGSLFGFIIFVGCFFVLGEKKLALHDMLAKTAVYKTNEIIED
jgi:uncharacterized RDD family membrane protein YckC